MNIPHRLATILFADIAGYTSLMEQDESNALGYLQVFHSLIEKEVASNGGVIQNFYGDGCLVSFNGSTDAVNCAVQLQKSFWKDHNIPVRIGLHTGEVVFDESNVYGNAVNIASRIESIGIPGSILLSKTVADQVSNNLGYQMISLGVFEFKNFKDAIEVMAISDFNFQVPKREDIKGKLKFQGQTSDRKNSNNLKLGGAFLFLMAFIVFIVNSNIIRRIFGSVDANMIAEKGILIPSFENQTGDSTFNKIGSYASMVITSALQSSGLAIVKDKATLDIGTNLLEAKLSMFSGNYTNDLGPNVRYVLNGIYLKKADTLSFVSKIIDLKNNSVIQVFPQIEGHVDSYVQLINQLKNEILGFWATKDLPLLKYNPPDYQSYLEYRLAIENWEGDKRQVLRHIKNCKNLDSTFYRAHLLELELYDNEDSDKADSMVLVLEKIKNRFIKNELNLYNALKAQVRNKNQAAFKYYMQEFENAPRNLYVNNSAMTIASTLINNPKKVVEIGEYIDWRNVPYNDCYYCQHRLTVQTRAYIDIGKEEKALEILRFAETSETDLMNQGIKELEIRALARLGRTDEIKEVLQKCRHQEFNEKLDATYFTYWAAREMVLLGKMAEAKEFAKSFFDEVTSENRNKYLARSAMLHLYLENYAQAEKDLKEILDTRNLGGWKSYFESLYAASLGFQGYIDRANEVFDTLSNHINEKNKPTTLYHQAIIYVSIGKIEQATSSLKDAIYAGKRFYRWEFQHEPIFKNNIPEKKLVEVLSLLH